MFCLYKSLIIRVYGGADSLKSMSYIASKQPFKITDKILAHLKRNIGPFDPLRVSGLGRSGAAALLLGLGPGERFFCKPRFLLRYSCGSLGNWRPGLELTLGRAQHCTNASQMEGQRSRSVEATRSLRNKRVSVRARVKLSWARQAFFR